MEGKISPNHKKWITIHMNTVDDRIVVLEYHFNESFICRIYNRYICLWCSVQWPIRKIKLVCSLNFMLVSKPDWCFRRNKWDTVEGCASSFVDRHQWFTLQQICMSNIYLTIVKRSLWIRTGTTSRYILPDSLNRTFIRNHQFQKKSKNRTIQLQSPNNFIVVEFVFRKN